MHKIRHAEETAQKFTLKGGNVNNKSVFNVSIHCSIIGDVNLVDRNSLNIADDVMTTAELEHLLRLFDATN
jgi:hypothetical protein